MFSSSRKLGNVFDRVWRELTEGDFELQGKQLMKGQPSAPFLITINTRQLFH